MLSAKLLSRLIMLSSLITILKIKNLIRNLCNEASNCNFVEISFNSGVAHTLRVGIKLCDYAKV